MRTTGDDLRLPVGFLAAAAAMLLDAGQSAWVFGGMNSWRDLGFAGDLQQTDARVSARLFHALNAAIAAATDPCPGCPALNLKLAP